MLADFVIELVAAPGVGTRALPGVAPAGRLSGRRSGPQQRASPGGSTPVGGSERLLTARSGRLAGKPDHFDRYTVTEYKSALPDPDWAEAASSIVDGYWRQLRLYSVLIGAR